MPSKRTAAAAPLLALCHLGLLAHFAIGAAPPSGGQQQPRNNQALPVGGDTQIGAPIQTPQQRGGGGGGAVAPARKLPPISAPPPPLALPPPPPPNLVSSSSEDRDHPARNAFDGKPNTYWRSYGSTPQWLGYSFNNPSPLQYYTIRAGTMDPQWGVAEAPSAWEVSGSNDGKEWTTLDRRFNQPQFGPTETRRFNIRRQLNADGAELPVPEFSKYRLTVVKVAGRSVDYFPAAIEELGFFTTDSLPRACTNLNSVNINVTVGGRPLVGTPESPTILYEMDIYVNISSLPTPGVATPALSLTGLRLPVRFSRAVQSPDDGSWSAALPEGFNVVCWGLYVFTDGERTSSWQNLCNTSFHYAITEFGVDLYFTGGLLPGGASVAGSPGYAVVSVQHELSYRMDVEGAEVLPPVCTGAGPQIAPISVPGRERHPSCVSWTGGRRDGLSRPPPPQPPCPSESALRALRVGVRSRFFNATGDLMDPKSARAPRELRLQLNITNTGNTTLPLAGVTVPISFSPRVYVPALASWIPAPPDQFAADCFWAQMTTAKDQAVTGLPTACEYTELRVTASGLSLVFLGGQLCAGCTVAGGTGAVDAFVSVKHVSYFEMDTGADAKPQALEPFCAQLAGPPAFCSASAPPPPVWGAAQ